MTNQWTRQPQLKGEADAGMLACPPNERMDREHARSYDELWCAVAHVAVIDYKRWLAQTRSVDVLLAGPLGADAYTAWHFIFRSRLYDDLTELLPGLQLIREHLNHERERRRAVLEKAGQG